jgi:hypothetical protein
MSASRIGALPAISLNSAALLAAWEAGSSLSPIRRGLELLAAAWPETSANDWAITSVGARDGRLLALREELFGSKFEAVAACPKCEERVEVEFTSEEIRAPLLTLPEPTPAKMLRVSLAGYEVEFRLPTSADLLEVTKPSTEGARETLLGRCVQEARREGLPVETSALPDAVVQAVTHEMAKGDPQADVQIAIACPACQHHWSIAFDILSYLWSELEDWAQRLLREVHALASAYGWSERDILAMSARRRRAYLEVIGA